MVLLNVLVGSGEVWGLLVLPLASHLEKLSLFLSFKMRIKMSFSRKQEMINIQAPHGW